ncbi:SRPBCC family protein [Agrococcus jenensis]|uniref:Polyketide cyclase/dehydrase/lipid transport protein n=1 Tax=Agrococcus jenensis TaxID=46353 RepID=A0A3N2AQR6_9MICO|nr:SRPBCC family protein [Agrococcus jenensis]ROR65258.1 polyketide cyclase/dehydrase/lipid transport protein [Agrococcus jenensis]
MSDITLTLERSIAAPPAAVWSVLTDIERSATVLSGVTRVERLAGVGYSIGTRWRETRRALGAESTEEMEVVGIDEGRSTIIAAEAPGMTYRTELTLEPVQWETGVGTLLRMRFSGTLLSPSWVQRAMATLTAPIGMAMTRKMMRQDLDDIAAAAEAA